MKLNETSPYLLDKDGTAVLVIKMANRCIKALSNMLPFLELISVIRFYMPLRRLFDLIHDRWDIRLRCLDLLELISVIRFYTSLRRFFDLIHDR